MSERVRPTTRRGRSCAESAAWRAHVDAALDPRYECAFAILDAVCAERQRPEGGATRIVQLRRELARLLVEIDEPYAPGDPRGSP